MGVAAALAVVVGVGFGNPAVARAMGKMPVIGKAFQYLYNLEDYEGKYTQLAQDVHPAAPTDEVAGNKDGETVTAVVSEDKGIGISVTEYYFDEYGLFLSVQVTNETAFYEENAADTAVKTGMVQLFGGAGSPVMDAEGVYVDAHTFLGIVKIEPEQIESDAKEFHFTWQHIKAYLQGAGVAADVRGSWEAAFEVQKEAGEAKSFAVNAFSEDGHGVLSVLATAYEIQVQTVPVYGEALNAEEPYRVLVFKQDGSLLEAPTGYLNKPSDSYDTWYFVRGEDCEKITLCVVDENKWTDEWQGMLYDDGFTGAQMLEFLKDSAYLITEVDLTE